MQIGCQPQKRKRPALDDGSKPFAMDVSSIQQQAQSCSWVVPTDGDEKHLLGVWSISFVGLGSDLSETSTK